MTYAPGDILLAEYRIEALLGTGSFGEVYLVTNLGLNVRRAIKVLRHDAPGLAARISTRDASTSSSKLIWARC